MGKDFKGEAPLHLKIAAGLTTGALGITVASPTDLVKVRAGRREGAMGRDAGRHALKESMGEERCEVDSKLNHKGMRQCVTCCLRRMDRWHSGCSA